MLVICDIETSDLKGTDLWLVMAENPETQEVWTFTYPDFEGFEEFASQVSTWVGQNFLAFDYPVLRRFFPVLPSDTNIYDTLVVSRLLKFDIEGGHSLEAWGERFKCLKTPFEDFSKLSQEMIDYCRQDLEVTEKLWRYQERFWSNPEWSQAIENEHRMARMCEDIRQHGFFFAVEEAKALHEDLSKRLKDLDQAIASAFLPQVKFVKEVHPKTTKHGTLSLTDFRWLDTPDLSEFNGGPFSRIRYDPFNPGSPKQMVERLNKLGWRPTEKTKTHLEAERERPRNEERLARLKETGWKVNEHNLGTLPESAPPEAHLLSLRLSVSSRLSDLDEWLAEVHPEDSRVHGTLIHIGAWTHRVAHRRPNTGNIASVPAARTSYTPVEAFKRDYDPKLRGLFRVAPGNYQIGVDMDSAHLRLFSHYIEDAELIDALISGDKAKGTDPHTLNMRKFGPICKSRDDAKTAIYTLLNGGQAAKLSTVFGCSRKQAQQAVADFTEAYPGLRDLTLHVLPRNAARGYFVGIDGRKVVYDRIHGQLSGILQNAEKIILTYAAYHGREECRRLKYPVELINLVHDEIDLELYEDDYKLAQTIGGIFADKYREAAEYYKIRCPFAGGVSIGRTWAEAH